MEKRKIYCLVYACLLGVTSVVMASPMDSIESPLLEKTKLSVEAQSLSCHPGYIIMSGNSSPGSHSSHEFGCSDSSCGSEVQQEEKCNTIWYYSTARYKCTKCGASGRVNSSFTVHRNSHCPSH